MMEDINNREHCAQARGSVFLRLIGVGAIFSIYFYFYFSIFAYTHYTADGHCNRKQCSAAAAAGRNAHALTFFPFGIVKRPSHTHTHIHTHSPTLTHISVHGSGGGGGCLSALLFRSLYNIILYMCICITVGSLTRLGFGGSKTYAHGSEDTIHI